MKHVLTNAWILDGNLNNEGKMVPKKGSLYLDGDKIEKISYDEHPDTSGYIATDIQEKYLLPGLINLHVHLASSGKPSKPRKKPINYKKLFDLLSKYKFIMKAYMKIQEGNAENMLFSGVTTIRTVGGIMDFDGKIRDKINSGKINGPRIFASNTAVSVPHGHFAGSLATEATSPEEAVEHVRMIAKTNPDWIKLMITGGVMDATDDGVVLHMSPEIIKAACDEAHKLGFRVCAHIESAEGIRVALENGVDTVEHGAPLDDYLVKLFKEKNAVEVCTLSPAIPCSLFGEDTKIGRQMNRKLSNMVLNGIKDCAKSCIENDIPLGLGTDVGCPYTTPYDTWRELYYFTKMLGVSPDYALYTATKKNAEILKIDDITGTIEAGKSADFIVSEKNPLEDFTTLRKLDLVCFKGNIFLNPKCKKYEEVEIELDKLLDGSFFQN